MSEKWRSIKNFEGIYEVSDFGNIRRIVGKNRYRDRKIVKGKGGYSEVTLSKNNKVLLKRVHRLVAEAFLPNPDNMPQVNHKNGDKCDNNVANLEWVSVRDNQIHSRRVLLNAVTPVVCIEANTIYPSMAIASEKTGINIAHIWQVVNNQRRTAGGYHWQACNGLKDNK